MRDAIATLAEVGTQAPRKVAVLGEMRELGNLAEEEHAALGETLFRAGVGLVIGCGGLIDLALDRATALGVPVVYARSTEEAAELVGSEVRPGDVVLFKGSRAVAVERVLHALARTSGQGEEFGSASEASRDERRVSTESGTGGAR
jgi:UDP-N-acetylmuramyl pentapeptide synthase